MNLTSKMLDVSKIDTGLPEDEKRQIHRRVALVAVLGKKYALHPDNAPAKGIYNRQGTRVA